MITLKGKIDLNFEKAPDVALRLGDTMREAEFELVQDIDLSDCTVSVFVVKPDSTFVITTGTITEDGKIIITWADQVAAVKGLGEYCIRISDNNDGYVFSARGKIWIDDHCVTDDMIESVAEVNGYTFPDDFATKDDITSFIDDDVITDDKTWSSAKLYDIFNEFSGAIDNLLDYSTNEKVIGKWTDGSTLYEKTFYINNPPKVQSGGYYYYNTIYAGDIDLCFITTNTCYDSTDGRWISLPLYRTNSDQNVYYQYWVESGTIQHQLFFKTGQPYNITKIAFTIRYTKLS